MIKVFHINYSDSAGGAARAANRLHLALSNENIQSHMCVLHSQELSENIISPKGYWNKLKRKFARKREEAQNNAYPERFPYHFSGTSPSNGLIIKLLKKQNPDLIHLHWVNRGTLSIEEIAALNKPIVWTMHDMWPFTGGCHYSNGCESYQTICQECPILNTNDKKNLASLTWQKKHNLWQNKNIHFISPSKWLADCAQKSALLKNADLKIIPNAIDTNEFQPLLTESARKKWGIPLDKFTLLFGATAADKDLRKGYEALRQALSQLTQKEKFHAIVFGCEASQQNQIEGIATTFAGHIHKNSELQELYASANVTILPSLAENLSNVILESMACGTPVIAFSIGGNADAIKPFHNGHLSDAITPLALKKAIEQFFEKAQDPHFNNTCRANARQTVLDLFDAPKIAHQHIDFYKTLL